jgi:hypothetical protein
MTINEDLKQRIGIALNEATLLGVEFNEKENTVACSFSLISMDKNGNTPKDNRLLFIFKPVGKFVASYRKGHWDDQNAKVEKFEPEKILEIVQSFQGLSIYGWDFINCGNEDFDTWKDRLSFDYSTKVRKGLTNTIDLFQEGFERHLDIRIWFDDFNILTSEYEHYELEEFLKNGERGWNEIYEGNNKMDNFGIIPATKENVQKLKVSIKETYEKRETKSWWTKIKEKLKFD